MEIFLCGFQQNVGLNIFCQHTKQQKISNILCIWPLKFHIFKENIDECLYRLSWISCCEPIINTIASKSGVFYITVLLIAEKNKAVCYLSSD